jgi:phage gpG-like protein
VNLQRLVGRLEALTRSSFIEGVKRRVAVQGLKLIGAEFASSTDPYGVSWPSLRYPRPGGPVLVKTGVMRDSILAYPTPDGVLFRVATPYAKFHQYGTGRIPIRRMVPATFLGIPPAWSAMVAEAFNAEIRASAS